MGEGDIVVNRASAPNECSARPRLMPTPCHGARPRHARDRAFQGVADWAPRQRRPRRRRSPWRWPHCMIARPTRSLNGLACEIANVALASADASRLVGVPPMQYLALWRMQLVSTLLTRGSIPARRAASVKDKGSVQPRLRALGRRSPADWRRGKRAEHLPVLVRDGHRSFGELRERPLTLECSRWGADSSGPVIRLDPS